MDALLFDDGLKLADAPPPAVPPGEALIDVRLAGICATDLEITRGYMGFRGILGHEFVGTLREAAGAFPAGQRVVGEINAICGECEWCRSGRGNHCPNRTVLGIAGLPGCFARQVALPVRNLHAVPDEVTDEEAVFTEPLAAAFRILEQVPVGPLQRVVLLGDGRLGLLAAQVLALSGCELLAVGKHPEKLALLQARGIRTALPGEAPVRQADVVVDATGSPDGFVSALGLLRPQGTLVLKSTCAGESRVPMAPLVVDEMTVVGSRCGPFAPALRALEAKKVDVRPLIHARFPLANAVAAFDEARRPGVMKVLLECG